MEQPTFPPKPQKIVTLVLEIEKSMQLIILRIFLIFYNIAKKRQTTN